MNDAFRHKRRILFGDCDPGGIVYTPRISDYVVEASLEFLRQRLGGPPERMLFEAGIAPPARALSIEFLHPMSWDEELETTVEVAGVREHAMALGLVGRVGAETTFTAELTLVCIATESRRPVPVPDWLRRALSRPVG